MVDTRRCAKCAEVSKRFSRKVLPEGLAKAEPLPFLASDGTRMSSQVQGHTYAGLFTPVERFIAAEALDLSRSHAGRPGDLRGAGPPHRREAEAP